MGVSEGKHFDVKTLILHRWDASQTKDVFSCDGLQRGQYISFQSHHFIDIRDDEDKRGLLSTYENLRKPHRPGSAALTIPDTHIVQNMPLLGVDANFWEEDADVLYITMIQLTDSSQWKYDEIYSGIKAFFNSNQDAANANWALYYSLDYCDYVLFTKNIKQVQLNNLLWEMAMTTHNGFGSIQDTFTMYSFRNQYLKDAFDTFALPSSEQVTMPIWDDSLALSMSFSLRDASVANELKCKITDIDKGAIVHKSYRLHGRYDMNITTGNIQGISALKIFYSINCLLSPLSPKNKPKQLPAISEYEIDFLSEKINWDTTSYTPLGKSKFDEFAVAIIQKLYNELLSNLPQNEEVDSFAPSYVEYVIETLRSLYELASSDFSEEFVLCVLPSLITFLRIIVQKQRYMRNETNDQARENIHISCAKLQKSYFTAMNTLSLCTMHSERQFIHTPAFNAHYFDIPPKLLAYYNAIVYQISCLLKESSEICPSYHYVIIPDYRTDIHVEPLNISYTLDTREHLAIINLPEDYFYEPKKAIMLFAHEVGHYEGNRERELRASNIFNLVAIVILSYTPLAQCAQDKEYYSKDTLLGIFAKVFGDYSKEQFDMVFREPTRGIRYLLDDISQFLSDIRYGVAFLEDSFHRNAIMERWSQALMNVSDSVQSESIFALRTISKNECSDYFQNVLSHYLKCAGTCEAISRSIMCHCEQMILTDIDNPREAIRESCQEIIELFAESFADMQMVSVFGKQHFQINEYCDLMDEINCRSKMNNSPPMNANQSLRYVILQRLHGQKKDFCTENWNPLAETMVNCIVRYLQKCGFPKYADLSKILDPISSKEGQWEIWCKSLCDTLSEYEQIVQKMYKAESNNLLLSEDGIG